MQIRVDCYAGYRGEETPRRFWLGETEVMVKEVLDRWLTLEYRYFKVIGDDDSVYIICHTPKTWSWELTFYRKSGMPVQQSGRYGDKPD